MSTTTQELRKKGFRSVVTFKESKHYLQKMERSVMYKLLEQAWKTDNKMRNSIRKEANKMKKDEIWIKAPCQKEMLKSNWGVPLEESEICDEFLRFPTNNIRLGKYDNGEEIYYFLPMSHDWENETLMFSNTRLDDSIEYKEKYYVTLEQTISGRKERLRIEAALERFDTSSEDQDREQFRKEPYFAYPERRRYGRWIVPPKPKGYQSIRDELNKILYIFGESENEQENY